MKKLLAMALALLMLAVMLPVTAMAADGDGSQSNPYTLEQLGTMTRDAYITAQERLGGTMYVTVGNYDYSATKHGTLGNGVRNDTTGQTEDRSVLNGYNSNGYLGEKKMTAPTVKILFLLAVPLPAVLPVIPILITSVPACCWLFRPTPM